MRHCCSSLLVLVLTLCAFVEAVKFDLIAIPSIRAHDEQRCISHYMAKDTLALVTVTVGQGYNQRVDIEVSDNSEHQTVYVSKRDISGELRNAFNTHENGIISVCFSNILEHGFRESPDYMRTIDLTFSVGADAMDYEKIAKAEKLSPLEVELRKYESTLNEILEDMDYLKNREARMRDTNELACY
ncbi:emp24/gp25L/p24 family/GOLD-domain-containing protein [Spinellus fusiger]|nr:emp24/gp25L/p24 family/GOLD-domain-containing protein [Spinellus fusiger]